MTNQSIYNGFERMWQHILLKLTNKSDVGHTHHDIYYTEDEIDDKLAEVNGSLINITLGTTKVKKAEQAEKDYSGNVITTTYETKTDAANKLTESKRYTDTLAANVAYIDENDNETVTLSVDLEVLSSLVGGDV